MAGQTGDQRLELVHHRDPDFESLERIAFQPTVVEKLLVGLAHWNGLPKRPIALRLSMLFQWCRMSLVAAYPFVGAKVRPPA